MGIVRLFAALTLLASACAHGDAGAPGDINTAILARYQAIVGAQDDYIRARNLQSLEQLLRSLDADSVRHVDDGSVDKLSALLGDDRHYARYYAARALGGIPCRAKRALPALRQVKGAPRAWTGQIEIVLVLGPDADTEVQSAIERIEAATPCSHVPNGPGHAAQAVHPEVPVLDRIYLPRTVAIDDDRHYPDAFRWSGAPPVSLDDAVDSMFLALPKVDAAIPDRDVCTFNSLDDMDSGLRACTQTACLRVPPTSRERGCGYLVQLSSWMEEAWLGGLCLIKVEQRSGPLIEWFRIRGVSQCHQMSTVLSLSLAQALVGKRQDVNELLRPFVVDNQSRD